jgi:hypothetical protein
MTASWEQRLFSESWAWLAETLRDEDIELVVPQGDPIRVWLDGAASRTARLLEVVSGADDVLTWLTLMDAARARRPLPSGLERVFSEALATTARAARTKSYPSQFHAFLSYSHRDKGRATLLVDILAEQGIRVFQDVRDIQAGESILGQIHAAMTQASRAILVVTENYAKSIWAHRELSLLRERQGRNELVLLPVLLDDVPLPELITDIFTIDLRGFRGLQDKAWAKERLAKLIEACK